MSIAVLAIVLNIIAAVANAYYRNYLVVVVCLVVAASCAFVEFGG